MFRLLSRASIVRTGSAAFSTVFRQSPAFRQRTVFRQSPASAFSTVFRPAFRQSIETRTQGFGRVVTGVVVSLATLHFIKGSNIPLAQESDNKGEERFGTDEGIDEAKDYRQGYEANKINPVVFLDISMDGKPTGRIFIRLFSDVNPITSEIFRSLCVSDECNYRGATFNRIIPTFMQQACIPHSICSTITSLFASNNEHEATTFHFDRPYLVAMAKSSNSNSKSSSNSRGQFFITTAEARWLDGEYVVVGKVIHGTSIVKIIDDLGDDDMSGKPKAVVTISDAGQLIPETRMQAIRDSVPFVTEEERGKRSRAATDRADQTKSSVLATPQRLSRA